VNAPRPRSALRFGTARSLLTLGGALVIYSLAQVAWILLASRETSTREFAAILTAQAIFAVSFLVVDNGSTYHGARLAARGELDGRMRASLIRLRVQLAAGGALIGTALALSGGSPTALAFAPYALALSLIGVLNTWERWGEGDSRPIAFWIGARGLGLVGLAGGVRIAGARLPLWSPGLIEGVVVVLVATSFRLGLTHHARNALGAERGPWRSTALMGMPAVLTQLAFASGVILLNAAGLAAAAAVVGMAVRLLGGVANGANVLTAALFPRLANVGRAPGRDGAGRLVGSAQLAIVGLGAASAAAACLFHHALTRAILGADRTYDEAALIAVLAACGMVGWVLNLGSLLIARHREREVFLGSLLGALLTVGLGGTVLLLRPAHAATWMAAALLVGQLGSSPPLLVAARSLPPGERRGAWLGFAGATITAVLVGPALLALRWAPASGGVEALLAVVALALAVTRVLGRDGSRGRSARALVQRAWSVLPRSRSPSPAAAMTVAAIPAALALGWAITHLSGDLLVPGVAASAIAATIWILCWASRSSQLLSPPVVMGIPLLVGLAASMAPVTETHWSWTAESVSGACGIALAPLVGMLLIAAVSRGSAFPRARPGLAMWPPDPRLLVRLCVGLTVLGVLVQLVEFARYGAIPLLSATIAQSRSDLQHTGPLHLLSDGLTLAAIIAAWARFGWPERFTVIERRVLLAIVFFVPAFLSLQGGRFVAAAPAIAAVISARPFLSRQLLRRVAVVGGVLAAFFSVAQLGVRFHQDPRSNPLSNRVFLTDSGAHRSLLGSVWNGTLINLGEGYRVADEFRHTRIAVPDPSTSVYFAHSFIATAQDPQQYALELSRLWITSTYAGPVILDQGLLPALVFGLLLGGLLQFVYVNSGRSRSPFSWWLYAYLAANFAFLFYVELPTQLPYLWLDPFALYGVYWLLSLRTHRMAMALPTTIARPWPRRSDLG